MLAWTPSLLLSFPLGCHWKQLGLKPQMTKTEGKCITLYNYKLRVENFKNQFIPNNFSFYRVAQKDRVTFN